MVIAGEPVIILRDREGVLRGMSNVCRHRMSTLLEGRGNVRSIVCPYHAWTYNLDGSLRGAPAMARNEEFCKEDVKLPQVRVEDWQGWIMVTLSPDAPPVAERLAGVDRLVGHLPMKDYREVFREECGDHRGRVGPEQDGMPRGRRGLQLPLDRQERPGAAGFGASVEYGAAGG
jgi:phenylpropionate dioxygenase-like ring-hydroxylating dioxygenase large terminal subunit